MATSDSDYSIDWLASDEDHYHSPKTLSPQHGEESPGPPSSSTSSVRESPPSCLHSGLTPRRRRKRRRRSDRCDCKDGGLCGGDADPPQTSTVGPVQGFTSVCEQLSVETNRRPTRSRAEGSDRNSEDEGFSQKCEELQRYIQPLSSILRGLRSGRYSERLSSFQESVAVDRIQRIMGVLQNPDPGFLGIILKIEEMLHSWFPDVRPTLIDDGSPAKKLKQQHRSSASSPPSSPPSSPAWLRPSDSSSGLRQLRPSDSSSGLRQLRPSDSSSGLRQLHPSPVCSLKTPEETPGRPDASTSTSTSTSPPPARRSQEVTQDDTVSSSTDSPRRLAPPPRGPPPFKIRSPCLERLLQAKDGVLAPRTDLGSG